MVDQSYYVPLLPTAEDRLNTYRANAIEENLHYLIRQWPAFEAETIREFIGPDGYLMVFDTASPAEGAEVTLLQHLPRLLVLIDGEGLEYATWSGGGWEALGGAEDGIVLSYVLEDPPSEAGANEALRGLTLGAAWNADLTISLAAERLDGSLRIVRPNLTQVLFRAQNTWGLLGKQFVSWSEAGGQTWEEAGALRKE